MQQTNLHNDDDDALFSLFIVTCASENNSSLNIEPWGFFMIDILVPDLKAAHEWSKQQRDL